LKLGSNEYFKMLEDQPKVDPWLPPGSQVDVQVGEATVSVR
jgi:hypothetical protein